MEVIKKAKSNQRITWENNPCKGKWRKYGDRREEGIGMRK